MPMREEKLTKVGQRVQQIRKEKGFTLNEVSLLSGYSLSWLSNLENGQRRVVRTEQVFQLAMGLGIHPGELLLIHAIETGTIERFPGVSDGSWSEIVAVIHDLMHREAT